MVVDGAGSFEDTCGKEGEVNEDPFAAASSARFSLNELPVPVVPIVRIVESARDLVSIGGTKGDIVASPPAALEARAPSRRVKKGGDSATVAGRGLSGAGVKAEVMSGPSSLICFCLRRRARKIASKIRASITARPPTTPPAMAPALTFFPCCFEPSPLRPLELKLVGTFGSVKASKENMAPCAGLALPSVILGGLAPLLKSHVVENGDILPFIKVRLHTPEMNESRTVVLVAAPAAKRDQ